MFIVLEGSDKVGKSSLAEHLSRKLGWPIVKFSQPKQEAYVEYMEFLCERTTPAIVDRFYLGELAYGPVKRGKTELEDWQVRNIEMLLMARFPLCIFCNTNTEEIKKKMKDNGETFLKPDEVEPLLGKFVEAINKSLNKWFVYNYLIDPDYEEIDAVVSAWYQKIQEYVNYIKFLVPLRTLGNFLATTLIVGDISNISLEKLKYRHVNVPFANGPSAELLYESLPRDGKKIMITNAFKAHMDNSETGMEVESILPNITRIVCLGNDAYDSVIKHASHRALVLKKKISIVKVPHPAYILRGGMTREKYAKLLRKAIK